jgi:Domain of unknown function (DUF6456)
MTPQGGSRPSAGEVAHEYQRLARQLLIRMVEGNLEAERRAEQIVLLKPGSRVSVAAGMPTGVLAELLQAGALRCTARLGRTVFTLTEEGRARVRRELAGSDPFASQHRTLETREIEGSAGREVVRVNTREDPLDFFRRSRAGGRLVGAAEIEAADRLRRDLAMARAVPQVTANWSRLVVDGAGFHPGLTRSEAVVEARRRVDAAMRAVGPDFANMLMDICGFSKGLETFEKENELPLRSGKVVVGLAFRALARHYGLGNATRGKAHAPMRHWGAEDYRPSLRAGSKP